VPRLSSPRAANELPKWYAARKMIVSKDGTASTVIVLIAINIAFPSLRMPKKTRAARTALPAKLMTLMTDSLVPRRLKDTRQCSMAPVVVNAEGFHVAGMNLLKVRRFEGALKILKAGCLRTQQKPQHFVAYNGLL
jgi:hypothetical protein